MSRRTLALGTLSLALGCGALGHAAEPCQTLRDYDAITAVVAKDFYDPTFRGLDWPARVASTRTQISCGDSDIAVARQVNALLSGLRASHTGLYTKHDLDYWALQSIFSRSLEKYPVPLSGIWPVKLGEAQYAAYVLDDSPAAQAGVLSGDLLISLNGVPFDALGFEAEKDATLVVSSDGRSRRTIHLRPVLEGMQNAFVRAGIASEREIHVGAKRVGYFHLWSGTHERFLETLEAALGRFESSKVDAVVLDLRGGFGGAGLEYLDRLQASPHLSQVPKYVLIDENVRSGKEWVAATVRQKKIGTLVGAKTAGYFLGGSPNRFDDEKFFLYLAAARFEPEGLPPIEGVGVPPDVAVASCRVLCAGRDPQLDEALSLVGAAGTSRKSYSPG